MTTHVPPDVLFEAHVDRSAGPDGCHIWTGALHPFGYGQLTTGGHRRFAHRMAWAMVHGEIPPGVVIRHKVCDNPPCVNVRHLASGTKKDNTADMLARGRDRHYSKLTESQVLEIVELLRRNERRRQIAQDFGVSRQAIDAIASGRTWARRD